MTIIRWRDRLAAFVRRVWAVQGLVEVLILAAILAVVCVMGGCMGGAAVSAGVSSADALKQQLSDTQTKLAKAEKGTDSLTGALKSEHQRSIEADQALASARGLETQAQVEATAAHAAEDAAKREAALAPYRTILMIVSIVSILTAIAGLVVFALSFVNAVLAFGRTIGVIAGVLGVVGFIGAQLINVALSHLVLVLSGAVALVAVAFVGWLIWDRHRGQRTAAEGMTVGDDALGRLQEMGKTSVEAAVHADAVKAAAIARQEEAGIKGRIEASLAHVRARVAKA